MPNKFCIGTTFGDSQSNHHHNKSGCRRASTSHRLASVAAVGAQLHSTCFACGMRSTAFPWAVVVLSAIWSGVHPVEVRVGGAAASPSQLKAFAAQVPAELYAALEWSFLSTTLYMNSAFSYFLPSSSAMPWPIPHLPPTFLFQSGCTCCCMQDLNATA
jgi:hypothetical protein